MKTLLISIFALIIFAAAYVLFYPLENDKDCKQACQAAHDALSLLNTVKGTTTQCDAMCPTCHPLTWRAAIRLYQLKNLNN